MSAAAKFWRTFAAGMVGVLGSVYALQATGDYRAATVMLGLGIATAVLAGALAGLQALLNKSPSAPIWKAVATAGQVVIAGLGAVVFNSVADLTSFPKLALTVGLSAVLAGAQSFFQNTSGG